MIAEKVVLVTNCDGTRFDYVEPSVVCAAQHALSILENEEGCLVRIEVNGEKIWEWDSEQSKKSCATLEELAEGDCVK
jgi:hypothetical protein